MRKVLFFIILIFPQLLTAQVKFFNTFGNGIYDTGEGVLQAPDTGYVVAGITTPTGSNGTDMLLYKTDSMGVLQWWKNIGGEGTQGARSIVRSIGGSGYVLAGYENKLDSSGYNILLTKTDLNGNTLWSKAYGGNDWDMAYSIDTLKDSSYIVAGETFSFGNGNLDMYVLKIDKNGDTLWTRTFGGAQDDYARFVYADRNGNIMVVGTTYSFGAGGADLYLVLMKPDGDTIWTKTHGNADDQFGYSGDLYIDNGNGMSYAIGYSYYNPLQDAQEARVYRGDSISGAYIFDIDILLLNPEILDHIRVRKDAKGKFYYCGDVRYTTDGSTNIYLQRTYYGIGFGYAESQYGPGDDDNPKDIRKCFDKGYVVVGETKSYGPGPTASFIMRTDSMMNSLDTALVSTEEEIIDNFTLYPNPVKDQVVYINAQSLIKGIRLYNISGQLVISSGNELYNTATLNLPGLPDGMYILELITQEGTGRRKVLVSH